jgi:hypothetical protein
MTTVTVREQIDGKARDVWNVLSDFGGIQVGGPITSFEIEGNGVGAVRTIGLGGGRVVERLERHDAEALAFGYVIVNDDSPLPVSNYAANVQITDQGNGTCQVEWTGTFEPKGASAADASKVVEGIYKSGIARARSVVAG